MADKWSDRSDDIGLIYLSADGSGNNTPFQFTGGGVSNSTTHSVSWDGSWYWIKGEVNESKATAKAKIWKEGNSEPSSYQVSCDITTGVGSGPVFIHANGDSGHRLDNDVAFYEFGKGLF